MEKDSEQTAGGWGEVWNKPSVIGSPLTESPGNFSLPPEDPQLGTVLNVFNVFGFRTNVKFGFGTNVKSCKISLVSNFLSTKLNPPSVLHRKESHAKPDILKSCSRRDWKRRLWF